MDSPVTRAFDAAFAQKNIREINRKGAKSAKRIQNVADPLRLCAFAVSNPELAKAFPFSDHLLV
jgi:hypothetical protein